MDVPQDIVEKIAREAGVNSGVVDAYFKYGSSYKNVEDILRKEYSELIWLLQANDKSFVRFGASMGLISVLLDFIYSREISIKEYTVRFYSDLLDEGLIPTHTQLLFFLQKPILSLPSFLLETIILKILIKNPQISLRDILRPLPAYNFVLALGRLCRIGLLQSRRLVEIPGIKEISLELFQIILDSVEELKNFNWSLLRSEGIVIFDFLDYIIPDINLTINEKIKLDLLVSSFIQKNGYYKWNRLKEYLKTGT